MKWYLLLACLVTIVVQNKGLELTFDRNDDPGSSVCAILNCNIKDNSESSEDPSTPSDLTVFRVLPLASDGSSNSREFEEIVSVNSRQSKVTTFSDDYNINGDFDPNDMFIRIYLKNEDYCSADFACRIRGTNSEGKELTSTTHIRLSRETDKQAEPQTDEKLTQIMKQMKKIDRKLYFMAEKNKKILKSIKQDVMTSVTEALAPVKTDIFDVKFQLSALIKDASSKDESNEAENTCLQTVLDLQTVVDRLESTMNESTKMLNSLETRQADSTSCPQQENFNSRTKALSSTSENGGVFSTELFPGACRKMDPLVQVSAEEGILAEPFPCDMLSLGGGWIVIQRRITGNVNFFRGWEDYKNGFGEFDGDFWLGNEKLHAMTSTGSYELRVELGYKGERRFAHYQTFAVGDEESNYRLSVMDYDGTAGDSLSRHHGIPFTTKDRDNDLSRRRNCATKYYGGWWYINCHDSNLNGEWNAGGAVGPAWTTFTRREPASYTEMKIRLRVEEP